MFVPDGLGLGGFIPCVGRLGHRARSLRSAALGGKARLAGSALLCSALPKGALPRRWALGGGRGCPRCSWVGGGRRGRELLPSTPAPRSALGEARPHAHSGPRLQRTRPLLAHRSPLAPQSCSHPNLLPRRRWGNEIQCETGRSPAMTIPNCQKQCFLSGLLKCRHSCFLC